MGRFFKYFLILILLVVLLFLSNPEKKDFIDWAMREVEGKSNTEIENLLGGVIGRPLLNISTSQDDYFLFSIFTIDKASEESKFIGFFRYIFIKLK